MSRFALWMHDAMPDLAHRTHGKGDHLTAHELSKQAHEHSMNAYKHAKELIPISAESKKA